MKRRDFLKNSAAVVAGTALFGKARLAFAEEPQIVALDNPTAKALGYHHDASKVDPARWPKKAGAEGAKQLCSNCNFAQGEAKKVEGKEGTWVGCQLFPGKLVASEGWCNSWTAKAAG